MGEEIPSITYKNCKLLVVESSCVSNLKVMIIRFREFLSNTNPYPHIPKKKWADTFREDDPEEDNAFKELKDDALGPKSPRETANPLSSFVFEWGKFRSFPKNLMFGIVVLNFPKTFFGSFFFSNSDAHFEVGMEQPNSIS